MNFFKQFAMAINKNLIKLLAFLYILVMTVTII